MYNWITVLYTWNKHEFTALPIGRITVWTLPPIRPEVALDSHRSMNWNPTVKVENHEWSEVAQVCPTLWDLVHCSLPGSSIHGIFQARRLEWTAISFSRENIMRLPQNTEKAMAPHSSIVAWRIPWMEEPGRLQSMGSQSETDWATSLYTKNIFNGEKLWPQEGALSLAKPSSCMFGNKTPKYFRMKACCPTKLGLLSCWQ